MFQAYYPVVTLQSGMHAFATCLLPFAGLIGLFLSIASRPQAVPCRVPLDGELGVHDGGPVATLPA